MASLTKTHVLTGPDVHEHDTVNHSDYALNEVRTCRWRDILIEDMFVVESMQKAVSPTNMMTTNSQQWWMRRRIISTNGLQQH